MREYLKFYIDGQWVDPIEMKTVNPINPATEEPSGTIALGSEKDVDRAVMAARKAFATWSESTKEERLDVLQRIAVEYEKRSADLAQAITDEMGAPKALASGFHLMLGTGHLNTAIEVLKNFEFEELRGQTMIRHEPIGVCAMITPWNWPVNQIAVKVFPAIAAGCTVVMKASQESHYSAQVLTEIIDAAGVPAGVFNMIQGKGSVVGMAMASHPEVDLVSITGSEGAGVQVAKAAAEGVKRVGQELGGKSANILLDDSELLNNVSGGVITMMVNSGQTCSAASRMLVPKARMAEVIEAARSAAATVTVGDPNGDFAMGPVVSAGQFDLIQGYIQKGVDEGAELIAGGLGRPEGLSKGFYVKPTVFANVTNDMVIAREEIFGPVLCILGYDDIDDAIRIANDSPFGLAGNVGGVDLEACRAVARRMRTGCVYINNGFDFNAPFGGYKRSGNGREWGEFGFHEYLEIKSMPGFAPEA
ncbi:aldehyde dehydrogenase family protein [Pseudomaricurvus sp. HS19]|uniref:aldehyde dehydrogenase family protein n=1 Tax=Pseudomaricurvus sp. HS19 TaxID=2692626 RepID=UPI001369CC31|nr:aldehyde dehydrogenase family protein [Pseudomaricurvus sp. HS19]MYM62404.1 aldehyde dehydrogenase family protein [Pseudomaricurvus sp. HS19]